MAINRTIDIRDVDWPLCLLNCNKEVSQMKNGDQIEIIVKDTDVLNTIVILIEQLSNHSIQKCKENKYYRLIIRKKNDDN